MQDHHFPPNRTAYPQRMELNKQAVFEYGIQIILREAKRALQDAEPPEKTKKHSSRALLETLVLPPFFSHYVQDLASLLL